MLDAIKCPFSSLVHVHLQLVLMTVVGWLPSRERSEDGSGKNILGSGRSNVLTKVPRIGWKGGVRWSDD